MNNHNNFSILKLGELRETSGHKHWLEQGLRNYYTDAENNPEAVLAFPGAEAFLNTTDWIAFDLRDAIKSAPQKDQQAFGRAIVELIKTRPLATELDQAMFEDLIMLGRPLVVPDILEAISGRIADIPRTAQGNSLFKYCQQTAWEFSYIPGFETSALDCLKIIIQDDRFDYQDSEKLLRRIQALDPAATIYFTSTGTGLRATFDRADNRDPAREGDSADFDISALAANDMLAAPEQRTLAM